MATILVTGASGVVGSALLPRLNGHRVIALTRRRSVPGDAVCGDITAPHLGLGSEAYRELAAAVDTVVHCAAITAFDTAASRTDDVNVRGTEQILEFTRDAQARLVYVSTAFVERERAALEASSPHAYVRSKIIAEERVRAAGLRTAIARPSVVIGHSATGAMNSIQGFYAFLRSMMRNEAPAVIPCSPGDRVDYIPCDWVGHALAALVDHEATGEYWLTSGQYAPTAQRLLELSLEMAAELRLQVGTVRLVSRAATERLAAAAPAEAATDEQLAELLALAVMFDAAEPFPSSLGAIPGGPAEPTGEQVEAAYRAALRFLSSDHLPLSPTPA